MTQKTKKQKKAKGEKVKIFVISGPGGVGKTTLINKLFCEKNIMDSCIKGITITTRPQRQKEKDGKDYFFIDKEEFTRLKKKKFFLESQEVLDNYYGTPRIFYNLAKVKNKSLVLCIDVKGGLYLKRSFKPAKIITVFIAAPTEKELYQRMKKREESKGVMKKRVELAKKEAQFSKEYDFVITNKNLKVTLKQLQEIIFSEH